MITLKLTPTEQCIFNHRLEIPECIHACLCVEELGDAGWHDDDIAKCIQFIGDGNWAAADDLNAELTADILFDIVDGNTYCCDLDDHVAFGELSKGRAYRIVKAAESLSLKVSEAIGRRCNIPLG